MEFQPIWISSLTHLEELNTIYKRTGVWKRMSGDYAVPEAFPQMKTPQGTVPLVYFINGSLELHPEKAIFKSILPSSAHSNSYKNLQEDVCFEINYSAIISIELYRHPKNFVKPFNIQWIRILTKDPILEGDFLLCAGNSSPSAKSNEADTRELYRHLIDFTIDTVK